MANSKMQSLKQEVENQLPMLVARKEKLLNLMKEAAKQVDEKGKEDEELKGIVEKADAYNEEKTDAEKLQETMEWCYGALDSIQKKMNYLEMRSSEVVDQVKTMQRQQAMNKVLYDAVMKDLKAEYSFGVKQLKVFNAETMQDKCNAVTIYCGTKGWQIRGDVMQNHVEKLYKFTMMHKMLESARINTEKMMDIANKNLHVTNAGNEDAVLAAKKQREECQQKMDAVHAGFVVNKMKIEEIEEEMGREKNAKKHIELVNGQMQIFHALMEELKPIYLKYFPIKVSILY